MTRTVHREVPGQVIQAAHLYLASRHDEAVAKTRKGDKLKGPYSVLASWCRTHGTQDDNGSYTWKFPQPITIGDETYTGITLQARQPSPYFDEDKAEALIDSLGPEAVAAATQTVVVYDYDWLFLALQQEKIASKDLDQVLITPPKEYSLTVLKGH